MNSDNSENTLTDHRIKKNSFLAVIFITLAILVCVISIFLSSRIKNQAKMQLEQLNRNHSAAQSIVEDLASSKKNAAAELEQIKKKLTAATAESEVNRKKLTDIQNKLKDVEKKLSDAENKIIQLENQESSVIENTFEEQNEAAENEDAEVPAIEKSIDSDFDTVIPSSETVLPEPAAKDAVSDGSEIADENNTQ